MPKIPLIGSVMTPAPRAVEVDVKLRVAQDLMIDHEIRHLPVTQRGALVGVLSDRDIAFTENGLLPAGKAEDLLVRDLCSFEVYAVGPEEPLDAVVRRMAELRIGSAIVTEGQNVTGLFTVTDACRCFAEFLEGRR